MLVASVRRKPTTLAEIMTNDCAGATDCGCTDCSPRDGDLPAYKPEVEKYHLKSELSENMGYTPEGFMICKNVPIARTGSQLYAEHEMPRIKAVGGIVRMEREPDQVFRAETMASFEGKPVTIDHPVEDVTPDNWKSLAVGYAHNIRRGTGIEDNMLLADLIITDREAIEAVRDGLREVSCGYDNKPEEIEPGRGRQTNIIGNHIALVANGRCGARCAIQDKKGDFAMSKVKVIDRLKQAFTARDEKGFLEAVRDAEKEEATEGGNVHVHVNAADKSKDEGETSYEERMKKMQDTIDALMAKDKARDAEEEERKAKDKARDEEKAKEEEKKKEEDKARDSLVDFGGKTEEERTRDAAAAYSDIVSRAAILAPGASLPKIRDGAVRDGKVNDALCIVKRHALTAAMNTDAGKKALAGFLEGKTVDALPCGLVDAAFLGASEIVRASNNSRAGVRMNDSKVNDFDPQKKGAIDAKNAEFWTKQASGK